MHFIMQQYTQEKQNNYVNKDKEKRRVSSYFVWNNKHGFLNKCTAFYNNSIYHNNSVFLEHDITYFVHIVHRNDQRTPMYNLRDMYRSCSDNVCIGGGSDKNKLNRSILEDNLVKYWNQSDTLVKL